MGLRRRCCCFICAAIPQSHEVFATFLLSLASLLFLCPSSLIDHHFDCRCLQSSVLHSQPKSTVGTPAYIAPEVLLKKEYDGKVNLFPFNFSEPMVACVTVWSSGVVGR